MNKIMDMINRFKNMDMTGVPAFEAKTFLFNHAKSNGFDDFQAQVIVKNVFGD
jgi:hypothetical protein